MIEFYTLVEGLYGFNAYCGLQFIAAQCLHVGFSLNMVYEATSWIVLFLRRLTLCR